MRLFDLLAILTVLAAGFSFLNVRLAQASDDHRADGTVAGVLACVCSRSGMVFPGGRPSRPASIVGQLDFNRVLLHGMLGFLLFAGALHVDLGDLDPAEVADPAAGHGGRAALDRDRGRC